MTLYRPWFLGSHALYCILRQVQSIAPEVKKLLIKAGFLPKFCHFSKFLVVAQCSESNQLQGLRKPSKWLGISRALLVGLYFEGKKICCTVLKRWLQQKRAFELYGDWQWQADSHSATTTWTMLIFNHNLAWAHDMWIRSHIFAWCAIVQYFHIGFWLAYCAKIGFLLRTYSGPGLITITNNLVANQLHRTQSSVRLSPCCHCLKWCLKSRIWIEEARKHSQAKRLFSLKLYMTLCHALWHEADWSLKFTPVKKWGQISFPLVTVQYCIILAKKI